MHKHEMSRHEVIIQWAKIVLAVVALFSIVRHFNVIIAKLDDINLDQQRSISVEDQCGEWGTGFWTSYPAHHSRVYICSLELHDPLWDGEKTFRIDATPIKYQ